MYLQKWIAPTDIWFVFQGAEPLIACQCSYRLEMSSSPVEQLLSYIKLLCEAQTFYVDGTFQTCPRLFYHIFIIHAFKNVRQFPLVYAVLDAGRLWGIACQAYEEVCDHLLKITPTSSFTPWGQYRKFVLLQHIL